MGLTKRWDTLFYCYLEYKAGTKLQYNYYLNLAKAVLKESFIQWCPFPSLIAIPIQYFVF